MLGKDDLITALTKTLDFSNVNCIATIWTMFVKKDMIPKRKVQLYEEGTLLKHSATIRDKRHTSKLKLGGVRAHVIKC